MKIFLNKKKLVNYIHKEKNLGFVPTMGAIHLGHISLIKKSINQCNKTIVTIFINKPQFNRKIDFKKYPRPLKKDIKILKRLKIDFLYLPRLNDIYPKGVSKNIKISSFANKLCGKYRPGHFAAIVDVVNRFIQIIKPKKIYFGQKDMQQLKIIEDFIKRNNIKTKVVECKTIREKNGTAYSSRNLLLSRKEKNISSKIYLFIKNNKKQFINRKISMSVIKNKILKLGASKIDYVEILDINRLIKPYKKKIKLKIFIAYYLRSTRLIDNI